MGDVVVKSGAVKRGTVWFVNLDRDRINGEQTGRRPAVIVSNNTNNKFSQTVNIVLATSRDKGKKLPVHVKADLVKESYFMCEQIITVSKDRLDTYIGDLSHPKMAEVQEAMLLQLGVN